MNEDDLLIDDLCLSKEEQERLLKKAQEEYEDERTGYQSY